MTQDTPTVEDMANELIDNQLPEHIISVSNAEEAKVVLVKALTEAHQAGIDEAKKTILHQLESHIDNVTYAPSKPSDYRAWQDGFMEAYQQARKVIQYGHAKLKSLDDTITALQDNK